MPIDFDVLLARLLDDIALSGSQGFGPEALEVVVKGFYTEHRANEVPAQEGEDLLFSRAPPRRGLNTEDDDVLQAFGWVCKHRDVELKKAPTVASDLKPAETAQHGGNSQSISRAVSTMKDKLDGNRMFVTKDRMWQAITGHGVNPQRIPPKEFECLSVVASAGPSGILQPQLCKITGQDKRSVPKRTDGLVQKGYITKTVVISNKSKTSLLRLKKFSLNPPLPTAPPVGTSSEESSKPLIFYESWFNDTIRLLKDNGNMISTFDLRTGLGIDERKWEKKALVRCLRRLEQDGCIRRLTAQMEDWAGGPMRRLSTGQAKQTKAIQLMREPTDKDRLLWINTSSKTKLPAVTERLGKTVRKPAADSPAGDDGSESDDEIDESAPKKTRIPPQWAPNLPYPNYLFNIIDAAGPAGLSSMALNKVATGPFYRRPLDEVMGKLTDIWQHSQPPHLRHLTLIRDTAVQGRNAHYQYRSFANFEKAVEAGDASWEAVGGDPRDRVNTPAKHRWHDLKLDEWGFPPLDPKLFINGDGCGTIADGMRTVLKKKNASRRKSGLEKMEDDDVDEDKQPKPARKPPRKKFSKTKSDATLVLATKRSKADEKEIREYDHIAQRAAEHRVMIKVKKELPSASLEHDDPVARKDLPRDQVEQIKTEILARTEPGIYINPPGSRAMKLENHYQRGRPRKCLIAVIKSDKLHRLPWFPTEEPDEPLMSRAVKEKAAHTSKKRKASAITDSNSVLHAERDEEGMLPLPKRRRGGPRTDHVMEDTEASTRTPIDPALKRSTTVLTQEDPQSTRSPSEDAAADVGVAATTSIPDPDCALRSPRPPPSIIPQKRSADDREERSSATLPPRSEEHQEVTDLEFSVAEEVEGARPSSLENRPQKRAKKSGTLRNGGFVAEQRAKAILDAVRRCNGVYPGNNEIWYPVTTAWRKRFKQTPDKHTVDRAVNNLIASGHLKKFTFTFTTRKGVLQTRSMFAEPGINPQSPAFRAMQNNVKETWPDQYIPPEVEVEPELRQQAANMYGRRKPQPMKLMDSAGRPLPELHPKPKSKYPFDKQATVRQAQFVAEHFDEEARAMGFRNAQAYRLHCVQQNPSYQRFWGRLGLLPDQQRAAWGNLSHPQATKGLNTTFPNPLFPHDRSEVLVNRIPLSSLRTTGHGPLQIPDARVWNDPPYLPSTRAHSQLDPEWLARSQVARVNGRVSMPMTGKSTTKTRQPSLVEQRKHGAMRTMLKLMYPKEGFSSTTGTFGSYPSASDSESTQGSSGSESAGSDQTEARQFFWDVDSVRILEMEAIQKDKIFLRTATGTPFVNHLMGHPHTVVPPNPFLPPISINQSHIPRQYPVLAPKIGHGHAGAAAVTSQPPGILQRTKRKYTRRMKTVRFAEDDPAATIEPSMDGPPAMTSRPKRKVFGPRDRRSAANFKDVDRLVAAYALVAALCGGINQDRMSWTIIAHTLGFRYEADFLRRRWAHFRKHRTKDMEDIRRAVRKQFLKAYEHGHVPKMDFQNLSKTDWPKMMTWVEEEVLPRMKETTSAPVPNLPNSRAELEKYYKINNPSSSYEAKPEEYFTGQTDSGRRRKVFEFNFGTPMPESEDASQTSGEGDILMKSWIRAVATTKHWHFDATAAAQKLSIFSNDALTAACKELSGAKIFTQDKRKRQLPGRNCQIHNDVLMQFRRWPGRNNEFQFLRRVAHARTALVRHFTTHDRLELIPTASDPFYVALTNMVAQGLLHMRAALPVRNDAPDAPFPKLSAWGYMGFSYETRRSEVRDLRYPIVYEKTAAYTATHGLRGNIPIPRAPPAIVPGELGFRIPFWIDIHGNLMDDIWDMVVRSVLYLLVFRVGYDAHRMAAAHKGKFGAWEISLVLCWMETVGLAVRCGAGEEVDGVWNGGWRAGPWWYCAFLPEIATWVAPAGWEGESVNL